MSYVDPKSRRGRRPPRRHEISHSESYGPGHHHRHYDEMHEGPDVRVYKHEEEYSHTHMPPPAMPISQLKMKTMNPHEEANQLLVEFPIDVIFTPTQIDGDPEEQKKFKIDIWKAILAAAKDQGLMSYDPCKKCAVPMDIKCMKGFVYKICIRGYQNTAPYSLGFKFPGTECSYKRNIDGSPIGTFAIDAESPYCCPPVCKYEARHKESVKSQLRKYGGYHNPEELWHGTHNYGSYCYVPATCMGAAIVLGNLYDESTEKGRKGFKVSTDIVQKHSDGTGYYNWPTQVIEKVNKKYISDVMPRLQGKLIDFRCAEEYVIEIVRADAKLEGEQERNFASREGTMYSDDSPQGDEVFNAKHRVRATVELFLGFTNKASIEQVCCDDYE